MLEADPPRLHPQEAGAPVVHLERVAAAEVHRHRGGGVHEEAPRRRPDHRVQDAAGERQAVRSPAPVHEEDPGRRLEPRQPDLPDRERAPARTGPSRSTVLRPGAPAAPPACRPRRGRRATAGPSRRRPGRARGRRPGRGGRRPPRRAPAIVRRRPSPRGHEPAGIRGRRRPRSLPQIGLQPHDLRVGLARAVPQVVAAHVRLAPAERFPQLLHAPVEVHPDRPGREPRALGDLGARHAFDEAEHERLAVRVRKPADGGQHRQRRSLGVGRAGDLLRQLDRVLAPAPVVAGAVPGDGGQPGSEGVALRSVPRRLMAWRNTSCTRSSASALGTRARRIPCTIGWNRS